MFSVNFNGIAFDFRQFFIAGSYKEFAGHRYFWNIPVKEFIVRADFYDFEALMNEIRAELPELFKASVAVEDGADVLCGVISGDTKIVCHNCFLLLRGKFFDGFVCIRQPDFVDVMQDIVVGLFIVACVALQNFVSFKRVFQRDERLFRLFLCTNKEDERFFICKAQVVLHPPDAMM